MLDVSADTPQIPHDFHLNWSLSKDIRCQFPVILPRWENQLAEARNGLHLSNSADLFNCMFNFISSSLVNIFTTIFG